MEQAALTLRDFSQYVATKSDLYSLAERNGYFLPKETSSIVTEKYLVAVLRGECWCPKYTDVRLLPCPKPPSKDVLIHKFTVGAQMHSHLTTGVSEDSRPDVKWLVAVIATLMPGDEIFKKDYLPPPRKTRLQDIKSVTLPLDLFAGMPLTKSKAKSRRLKIVSEALVRERIDAMKLHQKDMGIALLEQQIRLEALLRDKALPKPKPAQLEEGKRGGAGGRSSNDVQMANAQSNYSKQTDSALTGAQGISTPQRTSTSTSGQSQMPPSSTISSSSKQPQSQIMA